jgi:predicted GNAT superfamily acetyltransferase
MSSLYAQYLKDREEYEIVENEFGFATYKVFENEVYIRDIYVVPEKRKVGMAKTMADQVCFYAKQKGAQKLIGSVDITASGATDSLKVLLAYGMSIQSLNGSMIYLFKMIEGA